MMGGGTDGVRAGSRGIVAFDNSGTLSDPVVVGTDTGDDVLQQPVPTIPSSRPAALVSVALEEYGAFETDIPLSTVVADEEVTTGLALSNVTTTPADAHEAVVADATVPARTVARKVDDLTAEASSEFAQGDPPIGVQLVVDLDAGRIHRVLAYTTVPRGVAPGVVEAVRRAGYEPHLVSGDADHILRAVADEVAVSRVNIHPYQSADDKAETLTGLEAGKVVMVGDYVNDRFALDAADLGILIDDGEATTELREVADDAVPSIEHVPEVLDD